MTGMADEDNGAIFGGVALNLRMDLGYQGTGRIDYAQPPRSGMIPFTRRDAMCAEDDALPLGHLVEVFDKERAFPLECFEHEPVVHDLMTHIERRTISL